MAILEGEVLAGGDPDRAPSSSRELRERQFAGRDVRRALPTRSRPPCRRDVYVSFDIDGLDPSLCPDTGTPVPGGLSFAEAVELLRAVLRSGRRMVGADLCEVAPSPRVRALGRDVNAMVGARCSTSSWAPSRARGGRAAPAQAAILKGGSEAGSARSPRISKLVFPRNLEGDAGALCPRLLRGCTSPERGA